MEGQISLFDIFDIIPTADEGNHDKIKEIENREILKGSGFAEGKTRIYNYFQENHTEKEYADFLKNEYGVGGWSIDEGFCDHNANGIDEYCHYLQDISGKEFDEDEANEYADNVLNYKNNIHTDNSSLVEEIRKLIQEENNKES